jgi:hypothetical protein
VRLERHNLRKSKKKAKGGRSQCVDTTAHGNFIPEAQIGWNIFDRLVKPACGRYRDERMADTPPLA